MAKSQGGQANLTGRNLESFIEFWLRKSGYAKVNKKSELAAGQLKSEEPVFATQVYIGQTIYETRLVCDFLLYHPVKWPSGLVIESKWQQSSGSVDEKFPYLVANMKSASDYKSILLLDGGGYKTGSEKWLRGQVDDKLLHIFNMAQFQTWVNAGNL